MRTSNRIGICSASFVPAPLGACNQQAQTGTDSDIDVVDTMSDDKEAALITEHDGNIAYGIYDIAPDEGHGFRNKANRVAASAAYIEFLNTHLGASGE